MTRSVDLAMDEERPEKIHVRRLWLERLQSYREYFPNDTIPLYLTLSGAHGRDIQMLIASGIIRTTESGAIAAQDQGVVVAIESNASAVLQLQRRIPGLKILHQPFDSFIRSTRLSRFPEGDHIRLCQARVINLDLNEPVRFEVVDGELQFAPLQWVHKLCVLHAEGRLDWCLLLTLHGEAIWDIEETKVVAQFLSENFSRETTFASDATAMLGEKLYGQIHSGSIPAAMKLTTAEQQKLLMLYVPKRIAQTANQYGWRAETLRNLRYGGIAQRAPMVTWIIDFRWDPRVSSKPDAIYRDSLKLLLSGAGTIAEDGTVS